MGDMADYCLEQVIDAWGRDEEPEGVHPSPWPEPGYWRSKDGDIPIEEMSDAHISNILRMRKEGRIPDSAPVRAVRAEWRKRQKQTK